MKLVKKNVVECMTFLQENSAAPVPVHIRSIDFDSASGSYTIALLPAGLSYPDPTTPTRIKAGVVDDAAPTGPTVGTVLTDYNHCRAYLVFKNVGGAVVPAGNCTVTLWHRGIKGMEDATAAPAVGPWVQGPVLTGIFSYQEIVDVMLYHREVYLQLTTHVGALITTVEVFVAGIEDGAYQQPLAITPGGLLEVHLKDVKIEGGDLEVQIEAKPDDPSEKADSVINESTVDHTTPQTGNLAPPVMPIHIDSSGRSTIVGYVPEAGVMENDFPVKMAGVDHAGTRASLTTALGVANAELVYTAVKPGIEGNSITIQYVAAILATPVVSVVGNAIVFTGNIVAGIDAIVVLNAINADPYARMLANTGLAPANTGLGHIIAYGPAPLINGLNHSHVNIPDVNAAGETVERNLESSTAANGGTIPTTALQMGGTDGSGKLRFFLEDSLGRLIPAGFVHHSGVDEGVAPLQVGGSDFAGNYATLTTVTGVANSNLTYTAVKPGPEGIGITIQYIDGGALSPLTIAVAGLAISVTADIGAGVDALVVMNAINAWAEAKALVIVSLAPAETGLGHIPVYGPVALAGGTIHGRIHNIRVNGNGYITEFTANSVTVDRDATAPAAGFQIHGRAYSGLPAPVSTDGDSVDPLADLYGRLRVLLESTLSEINDSVKSRDIVPEEIVVAGLHMCSDTVGNTIQLTATSATLKRGVFIRVNPKFGANAMVGISYTAGNGTIVDAGGNPVAGFMFMRDDTYWVFIAIDDPSKLYLASDTVSTTSPWIGI